MYPFLDMERKLQTRLLPVSAQAVRLTARTQNEMRALSLVLQAARVRIIQSTSSSRLFFFASENGECPVWKVPLKDRIVAVLGLVSPERAHVLP